MIDETVRVDHEVEKAVARFNANKRKQAMSDETVLVELTRAEIEVGRWVGDAPLTDDERPAANSLTRKLRAALSGDNQQVGERCLGSGYLNGEDEPHRLCPGCPDCEEER